MKRPVLSGPSAVAAVVTVSALVVFGPRVAVNEEIQTVDVPADVDAWLAQNEARVPDIRPGDHKAVVWADSSGARTSASLVYLHGFSADRHELDPVPRMLAEALGANLFYTRLSGHGRDGAALGAVDTQAWLQDMAEAVAVGRRLGDRVILLGTSTGASLAMWAAAHAELNESIAALLLVSPNFHPRDRTSRLLLWPWGRQISRVVAGRERCFDPANEAQERHWTTCYPTDALLSLMGLVERVRTMDLAAVTAPALLVYSVDDAVVDPWAIEKGYERLGSAIKQMTPFHQSADPYQHILAGDIMSPETNETLLETFLAFLAESGIG
jgi:alpha-beta hydrolase superfamily lysophospholipase